MPKLIHRTEGIFNGWPSFNAQNLGQWEESHIYSLLLMEEKPHEYIIDDGRDFINGEDFIEIYEEENDV